MRLQQTQVSLVNRKHQRLIAEGIFQSITKALFSILALGLRNIFWRENF